MSSCWKQIKDVPKSEVRVRYGLGHFLPGWHNTPPSKTAYIGRYLSNYGYGKAVDLGGRTATPHELFEIATNNVNIVVAWNAAIKAFFAEERATAQKVIQL